MPWYVITTARSQDLIARAAEVPCSISLVLAGLWVMGNYRTGVAFPDCVTFGYEHAKVVREYLASAPASQERPAAAVAA